MAFDKLLAKVMLPMPGLERRTSTEDTLTRPLDLARNIHNHQFWCRRLVLRLLVKGFTQCLSPQLEAEGWVTPTKALTVIHFMFIQTQVHAPCRDLYANCYVIYIQNTMRAAASAHGRVTGTRKV